jgi:GNAT superfamily N-acetyltransferase
MQMRDMPSPTVRPATLDDVDFLCHVLYLTHLQDHPERAAQPEEDWVETLRAAHTHDLQGKVKDSTMYVIQVGTERVGRLRVVRTTERHELAGIQIVPDYQGQGIGTSVITTILQEASERAVPVELRVNKDNADAERLYARLGFRRRGEEGDDYWMTTVSS